MEKAILGAFAAALLMKLLFLDIMVAEGQSMVPAIRPGTVILVCNVFYGIRLPISGAYVLRWRSPREGDVLVFYTPLGEIAVKRCAQNLAGDKFFALGDNSPYSYDSRNYGAVSHDSVIGRVIWIK